MNAKPVRGITVTRWIRRFLAVILAWNLGMGIYDFTMGHLFGLISFTCVLGLAAVMTYQTRVIHRIERANRPRPDYSAIAAMERDIYGETFGHDGAPEPAFASGGIVSHTEHRRPVRAAKLPLARCWCSYCNGRSGVHGADAIALYRAQCEAFYEHRSNLRWAEGGQS